MKLSAMQTVSPPLFILGNPRSGTTLLRLVLTSNSKLLIPPECGFIIWLESKYGNWVKSDCRDPVRVSNFLDDLFVCKKFDTWGIDRKIVKGLIEEVQPSKYRDLCGTIYIAYGFSTERFFSMWGDKNNFYIHHLNKIFTLFENARFLHIVRDGRDVACSYREVDAEKSNSPYAPKLNTEIPAIALEWTNNVMKVDSFMCSVPKIQAMTVKYEDFVKNPSDVTKMICDWLGIPFEPKMLNFYQINSDKNLEPKLTMDWKKRTLLPISDDTVGRHKKYLNKQELFHFEFHAALALARFDYI